MGIRLKKKIFIEGTIEVKTGLSIGGSSVGLEIGGADKVVVRNPTTNQPYIPGSSLKGKMRNLLEKVEKGDDIKHKVAEGIYIHQCGEDNEPCPICKIFGLPAEHKKSTPARLIVRDSDLIGIMKDDKFEKGAEKLLEARNTDMPYTEVKTEVVIDRITSSAIPRNFERVPAGAVFDLDLICNIYEDDDEKEMLNEVFKGLKLVQDDYLGGSGTRGYGQVKFKIRDPLQYKDENSYEKDRGLEDLKGISIPKELK